MRRHVADLEASTKARVEAAPCDGKLGGADPALLARCFQRTEQLLFEPAMREAFGRLGGRMLIARKGTKYFRSQRIACPHCQTRKRSNGKIENYQPRAVSERTESVGGFSNRLVSD